MRRPGSKISRVIAFSSPLMRCLRARQYRARLLRAFGAEFSFSSSLRLSPQLALAVEPVLRVKHKGPCLA